MHHRTMKHEQANMESMLTTDNVHTPKFCAKEKLTFGQACPKGSMQHVHLQQKGVASVCQLMSTTNGKDIVPEELFTTCMNFTSQ